MTRAARALTLLTLLVTALLPLVVTGAAAHPLAPSLLELRQATGTRFAVRWKTSAYRPTGARVEPVLPEWCTQVAPETVHDADTFRDRRWVVDCGERGLRDATLGVTDLDVSRTLAMVRVELADGRSIRELLDGARPRMTVPEPESRGRIARGYLELGVEHLLTGVEHLLFVLCLCLLIRERRALVLTIAAFAIGHSVTLTLATLGLVRLPPALAGAAIALSLVLVAAELLREDASDGAPRRSWLRRRPWGMAFVFGLVHGLGFAAALGTAGLPQVEVPLALLSFNVGIELGQVAFVAALLVAARLARPLVDVVPANATRVPAYVIGSIAAFWFWSRAGTLLGALLPS